MSKTLFEAHITFDSKDRETVEANCPQGWKFSAIDGDPVLGKQVFCYLTSYDESGQNLLKRMKEAACYFSVVFSIEAVRQKVEQIVYDTKTGRDDLTFKGCVTCNGYGYVEEFSDSSLYDFKRVTCKACNGLGK